MLASGREINQRRFVVNLSSPQHPFSNVASINKISRRASRTPELDATPSIVCGFNKLADERWNHMRIVQIEVVIGTVDIPRDRHNDGEVILLPVGERLNMEHAFSERIGRAVWLRKTIPEGLFFLWQECGLRIATASAGANYLLHTVLPCLMHGENSHHQVLVEKISGPA